MIVSYTLFGTMSFGVWLKNKRTELRISGAELERLSGVSRQYISNLERELVYEKTQNAVKPSVDVVDKLAKALGIDNSEARLAAGYAANSQDEAIKLDVSPDLRVSLLRKDFRPEDRRRIEMVLRASYQTAVTMIEADRLDPDPMELTPTDIPYYGEANLDSEEKDRRKAK